MNIFKLRKLLRFNH